MRWIFLLLPWVELFTLIRLGSEIGAMATLLYVFVTLVLGMALVRWQGMELLARLQQAQAGWGIPPQLLRDDLALGLAGLLLAIPGLVTDCLAALVLVGPGLRRLVRGRQPVQGPPPGPSDSAPGTRTTIEGDYRRIDDD